MYSGMHSAFYSDTRIDPVTLLTSCGTMLGSASFSTPGSTSLEFSWEKFF